MAIVLECFDRLPKRQRDWINGLWFNLHDDHILRGEAEVDRCMREVEAGRVYFKPGNSQN